MPSPYLLLSISDFGKRRLRNTDTKANNFLTLLPHTQFWIPPSPTHLLENKSTALEWNRTYYIRAISTFYLFSSEIKSPRPLSPSLPSFSFSFSRCGCLGWGFLRPKTLCGFPFSLSTFDFGR